MPVPLEGEGHALAALENAVLLSVPHVTICMVADPVVFATVAFWYLPPIRVLTPVMVVSRVGAGAGGTAVPPAVGISIALPTSVREKMPAPLKSPQLRAPVASEQLTPATCASPAAPKFWTLMAGMRMFVVAPGTVTVGLGAWAMVRYAQTKQRQNAAPPPR